MSCPLYISKVQSVVSMAQLLEDGRELPEIEIKDLNRLTPNAKIADVMGSYIPFVGYASTPAVAAKAVRSFVRVPSARTLANLNGNEDSESVSSFDSRAQESDGDTTETAPPRPPLARSYMDAIIMTGWEDRKALFRYPLADTETKVVPGKLGFVAQLNEGRATKKRATEFRVDLVTQEFDDGKFNFTKALQHEALFQFAPSRSGASQYHLSSRVRRSPSLVLINVSPIEYGHVLLCPWVLNRIPQLVDPANLLLALHFANESANPCMRLGYNSLGAYGTINHMHYQAYYMQHAFPVELAETVDLCQPEHADDYQVSVQEVTGYPARCLVFEVNDCLEALADVVGRLCQELAARNVPHNLLICDTGHRVFLFPNNFSAQQARGRVPEDVLDTGVNPACFEIAGHMVMKRRQDYEDLDEAACERLLAPCSFPAPVFDAVAALAEEAARLLPHQELSTARLEAALAEMAAELPN